MDDDALDAIDVSDFWLDDSALDADSTPVQSLDFGLLLGDVVPRDGLQRPLLTSGSPVRTPVPRRASKQPINVTHIHQTVVQQFGPVQAACPTTVAEGTSGSLLGERPCRPARLGVQASIAVEAQEQTQVAAGMHRMCMMAPLHLAQACQPHCTHPRATWSRRRTAST